MSPKKLKKKDYTEKKYYVINIKIQSEEENKQSLYSNIFYRILNLEKFHVKIGNKNGLVLKKLDKTPLKKSLLGEEVSNLEYSEYEILSGELVKFKIEDENDKYFNTVSRELESANPNSINKPNAIEIPFYFIPSIHRLLLPVESNMAPNKVKNFFEEALLKLDLSVDNFNIDIAKKTSVIDRIYKLKTLKKLELEISYTNDDLSGDAKKFMDDLLKESNVNKYKGEYDADKKETLNVESKLIKGGIELSKENGSAKAVGINSYGNREVINTKNEFEQLPLKIRNDTNQLISVLKEALMKWRI